MNGYPSFYPWIALVVPSPGDKPWSEPMVVKLLTLICVTRPQRVNLLQPFAYIRYSRSSINENIPGSMGLWGGVGRVGCSWVWWEWGGGVGGGGVWLRCHKTLEDEINHFTFFWQSNSVDLIVFHRRCCFVTNCMYVLWIVWWSKGFHRPTSGSELWNGDGHLGSKPGLLTEI